MQEARLLLHSRSKTVLPDAYLTAAIDFFFNLIVHISNSNFTLFENDLNFYIVGNTGLSITNLYGMAR